MARNRRPISYADPLHLGRHPFQTYLLALCIIGSFPLLLGHIPAKSIQEALPLWVAVAWGWSLAVGSATALIGSYWRGRYVNSLTTERLGLIVAGAAACVYGITILVVGGWGGVSAASIVLAFAAASIRRAYDIGTIFVRAVEEHSRPVAREDESDVSAWLRSEDKDA